MREYRGNIEDTKPDPEGDYFIPYPQSARHRGEVKLLDAESGKHAAGTRVSFTEGAKPREVTLAGTARRAR